MRQKSFNLVTSRVHLGRVCENNIMPLSHDNFLAQVAAAQPRTAVFDYDGTLWPGDAGTGFMHWTVNTGLLSPAKAQQVLGRHGAYHRGEVDESTICGEMVQIYAGLPESVVRASAQAYFAAEVEPHLFPSMVDLVRSLKQGGVEIWAVSSTNNWVIEEGVRALGIAPDRVLGACVQPSTEGIISKTICDIPSDEGKAVALRRVGLHTPDVVFGNSIHDAAMLALARVPFAVNPSPGLQALAANRGWAVYFPATPNHWRS